MNYAQAQINKSIIQMTEKPKQVQIVRDSNTGQYYLFIVHKDGRTERRG